MVDPNPLAHFWWWFEVHSGTAHGGPDPYYNFWSGIGSDIGEYSIAVSVLASLAVAVHHLNCKTDGCKRIGKAHRDHRCKRCYVKDEGAS
jgi:hypothetical protein